MIGVKLNNPYAMDAYNDVHMEQMQGESEPRFWRRVFRMVENLSRGAPKGSKYKAKIFKIA